MRADRVRLRNYGSQGHEVTSNIRIDQSLNQTGNESPTLIPPRVKKSNKGRYNTVVHLCPEVTHELTKSRSPKSINL